MFGLFNKPDKEIDKAAQFVANNMMHTLGHLRSGPLAHELFQNLISSPYHTGYVQGKISGFLAYLVHSGHIADEHANTISGMSLLALFEKPKVRQISSAIKSFSSQNSKSFQDGYDRGSKVALYTVKIRDIEKEPDVEKARDHAKATEEKYNEMFPEDRSTTTDSTKLALMGLEMIWFTETLS